MKLGPDQLVSLELAYRDGATMERAAHRAGCSVWTVHKYFHQFDLSGIPRGGVKRLRVKRPPGGNNWSLPKYTGPDWIGKPITQTRGGAASPNDHRRT
jgi:hypothetical protein